MKSTQDTGRVTKVAQLPWLMTRARRILDSSMEPSSKPRTKGPLGNLNILQEEAQNGGGKHNSHIKEGVVQGERPHHAQDTHGGPDGGLGDIEHLGRDLSSSQAEDEEYHVGQQHHQHDLGGKGGVLSEHLDAGLHSVHGQRTNQDGGHRIAWNTQGHHGGHGAADDGIVGG